MTTHTENVCWRKRKDCVPAANLCSDSPGESAAPKSFICIGWNSPKDRSVSADRFTFCWKNTVIDQRDHLDKRDLLDTLSVIGQALSVDENVRVNEALEEREMQQINMIG
jgi:hypothetical protein